jgi:transposase-like protein
MTQTRFTPELWATVLERVSNGESLRQVARSEGFPPEATIRNWIRSDQELATQYAQARALQIESWADEVRDEAFRGDLEPNDRRVRVDG